MISVLEPKVYKYSQNLQIFHSKREGTHTYSFYLQDQSAKKEEWIVTDDDLDDENDSVNEYIESQQSPYSCLQPTQQTQPFWQEQ